MPQTYTSPAHTTPLDERSFEQLLAAAFVIQEHNKRTDKRIDQPAPRAAFDFTRAVSAAAALQEESAAGTLDLPAAARVIAERALQVMHAQGAAVGIVVDEFLTYIGAAGTAAGDSGRKFAVPQSLPAHCILKGEPLQYSNSQSLARGFAGRNDLQSLLAAPVMQKGTVLGVLELRFSATRAFSAEEIRAAELFAGSVNLAITTAARKHAADFGDSPAPAVPVSSADLQGSRAPAVPLISPVQPLPEVPLAETIALHGATEAAADLETDSETDSEPIETLCASCGRVLFSWESICARCGTRKEDRASAPPLTPFGAEEDSVPSQFRAELGSSNGDGNNDRNNHDALPTVSEIGADSALITGAALDQAQLEQHPSEALALAEPVRIVPAEPAGGEGSAAIEPAYPWSSAQKAREWFDGLREQQHPAFTRLEDFWESQRANVWLGAAALILLFAIVQFFASPGTPAPVADTGSKVAAPQLTFFEGLMVSMGLAEAPPAVSSYAGNPQARVWVDTRTALYYCEGAGQYGKTPGGKFTTQRDAQQDQFEPAHRKVCP
jgi:hypothetical protein